MKILLIDDKSKSLNGLSQICQNQGCKTALVSDPLIGLKLLSKHKFDVAIVAQQIQKTSNVNLLKAIAIKFPSVVRIAIFDNDSKTKNSTKVAKYSHYVFEQPINTDSLVSTVKALEESRKVITKQVVVKAVASVKTLPSPPKVYMQLNAILKNSNSDSEKIAEIITQDPGLTAKVLQFSNNTFMQKGKQLTNISEAITKMGVDTLSCIVMTAELFSYQPDIPNFSIIDEQLHSLATARFAASLVPSEIKQDTLLAGLLHDIGKLVLFEIDKDLTLKYFDNKARTTSDVELEKRIFSTDHSQIGAYLLHVWSFPYHVIDAVLLHHNPAKLLKNSFGIAQAIYLANSILKEQEPCLTFVKHYQLEDKLDKLKEKAQRFKS